MLEKTYSGFTLDIDASGIALIRFNRPERLNTLDISCKRDLIEALVQLQYSEACRVIVITGSGKAFSAGDNVAGAFADEQWAGARSHAVTKERRDALGTYSSLRTISQQVNRTLLGLDKITIAAINGSAVQSGLSVALACDFRLTVAGAKIGSGTIRMGYLPDEGGHFLIERLIGLAKTKDFLLRGRIVDGAAALALGLVHEVVPDEQLLDRAMEMAREFAEGPQVALRLLNNAIDALPAMTFDQAGMDIAARTAISDHHPDCKEGWLAFREKRKPRFA